MNALFLPPGEGRYLSTPQIIGAFASFALYPLIKKIVTKRMPDADAQQIKNVTGCITVGICLTTVGIMYFILHI